MNLNVIVNGSDGVREVQNQGCICAHLCMCVYVPWVGKGSWE